MKKPYFILLLAIISILFSSTFVYASPTTSDIIDTNALDAIVVGQMAKHGLPGVALAVIDNGEVIYQKGYGVDGNGDPMTPQTKVFIGSQSKSFTALAIAQLAEQGKLDLNASVQTYIPWFKVADEGSSSKITINHLLHHTSGLSDAGYGIVLPLDTSPEDAVRSLEKAKLTAPIGTRFQYFNMGYAVLSYLIELESGQSYADFVQENILTPLRMDSSTADPATMNAMPNGYTRLFGFALPAKENYPLYGVGEGWIISTAEDMAKYAIEFQSNNAMLVSEKMMKRILSPGNGYYGMGWFIYDNGTKIVHGGANQTFRTEVNLYPNRDRAFVLLTNEGHMVDHFVSASQLTSSVEAVILGKTPPSIKQGLSTRWIGWAMGIFVLGLGILHTRNFLSLRGWKERMSSVSEAKRTRDIAISFIIPVMITMIVFWQVSNFFGNRFNFISSVTYMRQGMPDIFILILIGTLPDLIQGVIKIVLWNGKK
ncbi:MAG: beta-lactamase family protein [Anaerolineaceae bacterium]|nr:beta-lactamase family protein [Anaerolineaceae bacterium]